MAVNAPADGTMLGNLAIGNAARGCDAANRATRRPPIQWPGECLIHYNLGLAYKWTDHSDKAVPEISEAIRLAARNWPGRTLHAWGLVWQKGESIGNGRMQKRSRPTQLRRGALHAGYSFVKQQGKLPESGRRVGEGDCLQLILPERIPMVPFSARGDNPGHQGRRRRGAGSEDCRLQPNSRRQPPFATNSGKSFSAWEIRGRPIGPVPVGDQSDSTYARSYSLAGLNNRGKGLRRRRVQKSFSNGSTLEGANEIRSWANRDVH